MTQGFATFILMNNYFHDVATAMLLACSIVLWVFLKHLRTDDDRVLLGYARKLYGGVSTIFWFSVAWIIVSGFIRVATFTSFEWVNAGRGRFEAGLVMKYAIAGCMILIGIFLWSRLSREMKDRLSP